MSREPRYRNAVPDESAWLSEDHEVMDIDISSVNASKLEEHEDDTISPLGCFVDTACTRTMGSLPAVEKYIAALPPSMQKQVLWQKYPIRFTFANGQQKLSKYRVHLPTFSDPLVVQVLQGCTTPILLSVRELAKNDAAVDMGLMAIRIKGLYY